MKFQARTALAVFISASTVLVGCSSDDAADDASSDPTTTTEAPAAESTTTTTEAPAAETLTVLVTNDDGIGAEGIDAVVNSLLALDDIEVLVYAPAEQQSGTGPKTTEGGAAAAPGQTASGYAGIAVDGFPADSVNYAFDVDGVEPDVVVSGLNHGANLGAFVEISGTVGAARAATTRGIPSLASSMGATDVVDWDLGAQVVSDWVSENREALLAGTATVEVMNVNVPTCSAGEVRGEVTVDTDYQNSDGSLMTADCTSTEPGDTSDLVAFSRGFITWSVLTLEPTPNQFTEAS